MDSLYNMQQKDPKIPRNDAQIILGILFGLIITLVITIITVPSVSQILSIAVLIISLAIPGVIYYSPAGNYIKNRQKTSLQNNIASKNKERLLEFLHRFQKLSQDYSPIHSSINRIIETQKTITDFVWLQPNHYWIEEAAENLVNYITDAKSFSYLTDLLVGVIKDNTDRLSDAVKRLNAIEDLKIPKDQLQKFKETREPYNTFIDEYQSFREEINKKFKITELREIPQVNTCNIEKIPEILPE